LRRCILESQPVLLKGAILTACSSGIWKQFQFAEIVELRRTTAMGGIADDPFSASLEGDAGRT
jgi:hypothetical protein